MLTGGCHNDRILTMIPGWTDEGAAATDVVLRIFRVNGLILAAGDGLAAKEGLTAARWQVLGAVALAGRPLTVPHIARRMGLTRQSVQASVNRLLDEGLMQADHNPDHQRSVLVRLTKLGTDAYARLQRRQVAWINELAAGFKVSELATTACVLSELTNRLNTGGRSRREEMEPG
jgi:DNA-binding MarR family transcriptional regulator